MFRYILNLLYILWKLLNSKIVGSISAWAMWAPLSTLIYLVELIEPKILSLIFWFLHCRERGVRKMREWWENIYQKGILLVLKFSPYSVMGSYLYIQEVSNMEKYVVCYIYSFIRWTCNNKRFDLMQYSTASEKVSHKLSTWSWGSENGYSSYLKRVWLICLSLSLVHIHLNGYDRHQIQFLNIMQNCC